MLLDDVNPIDFDLVHDAIDEEKILFSQHKMVTPPWC